MTPIHANTKIAALLRAHPDALEAIVSISPKFNKLRNPLLRKLMASRATIGMASRIGGCTPEDFFTRLEPLGFVVDRAVGEAVEEQGAPLPAFMQLLKPEHVQELDVRPILNQGQDPFNLILGKVKALKAGETLKIINDFEPIPLIQLLGKQGFGTYSKAIDGNTWHTWFFKTGENRLPEAPAPMDSAGFDACMQRFVGRTRTIDVRHLEMPLPMLTILDELDHLPAGHALFVDHKRIPVFLLPELEERKFEYRAKELGEGDVKLFIFRA
ncbi:MAG: DUF2249 domain-containing protein [Flavobacteriales bacterium]|nr:DUF2249 domain-containing protein [Flavobacteriales bacterium]MBP9079182.1 DUF2249 domain-containing protein [Flavobacteriales bacterium]